MDNHVIIMWHEKNSYIPTGHMLGEFWWEEQLADTCGRGHSLSGVTNQNMVLLTEDYSLRITQMKQYFAHDNIIWLCR